MGAYRGNADKVMADAKKIARLWSTGTPLLSLKRKYHCSYSTIVRVIRSVISKEKWQRIRDRHLTKNWKKFRFKKGTHYNPGGRNVETRFKKGCIRGWAAQIWRPVGTITIRHDKPPKRLRGRKRKEGIPPWRGKSRRWIKVKDTGRSQDRWLPYARYLWEKEHGQVPKGYLVVHIDGDQMYDEISNFRLVDRRGHLVLQMKRDPGHKLRCRAAAGKATRRRHEINRQRKLLYGQQYSIFECVNCGADYRGRKAPNRCIKCGCGSFLKTRYRQVG